MFIYQVNIPELTELWGYAIKVGVIRWWSEIQKPFVRIKAFIKDKWYMLNGTKQLRKEFELSLQDTKEFRLNVVRLSDHAGYIGEIYFIK